MRALTVMIAIGVSAASVAQIFKTYHNDRFGFEISYPGSLKAGRPPDNGDGREFKSSNGQVVLAAWSGFKLDEDTLKKHFQDEHDERGRQITYEKLGKGWFVISGTQGAKVFYEKVFLRKTTWTTMSITYPKSQKAKWDRLTERIAKSLRPSPGNLG